MLTVNKERLFRRLQLTYDAARAAVDDISQMNKFMTRFGSIDETYNSLQSAIDQVLSVELDLQSENAISNHQQQSDSIDEIYCAAKQIAYDLRQRTAASRDAPDPHNASAQIRLPKIELRTFNGKLSDWPAFFDNFKSLVHNQVGLSNSTKYHYLLSCLSGPPLALARALPNTETNYAIVWQSLIEQYQNTRLLATDLLDSLLAFKPLMLESCSSLSRFLSEFLEIMTALRALDIPNLSDFLLFSIACKKLPQETRILFEQQHTDANIPTVNELTGFVRKQVRVLELSSSHSAAESTHASAKPRQIKALTTAVAAKSGLNCAFCSKQHLIYKCYAFESLPTPQRLEWSKTNRVCTNCLKFGHEVNRCSSKVSCFKCKARHHTLLHDPTRQVEASEPSSAATCHSVASDSRTLLGTIKGLVQDRTGQLMSVRMLLDSGSMSSFITLSSAKRLGIKYNKRSIPIAALGNVKSAALGTASCIIQAVTLPDVCIQVDVIVVDVITSTTPCHEVASDIVARFKHLPLADPQFYSPGAIDVLLGADVFPTILSGERILGSPSALNTSFGWVVMGTSTERQHYGATTALVSTIPLDDMIRQFWQIEEPPDAVVPNPDDVCAETKYHESALLSQGRFTVPILVRDTALTLGDSYKFALSRLYNLERRLTRQPQLQLQYVKFMREYLHLGHMTLVHVSQRKRASYYVPHHCIAKPDDPSKIRVVFDATMPTTTRVSLNDVLLTGPKLQCEIFDVILAFRVHAHVFTTDICKMYRQILITPADRTYQHILWRESAETPVLEYQLNTITYGLRSSPFLAIKTLHRLAESYAHKFPLAARAIQRDTYVDDVLTGASTLEEALSVQQQLIELLRLGGFELSKWASNTPHLIALIPDANRQSTLLLTNVGDQTVHILGFVWNSSTDAFQYNVKPMRSGPFTKRTMLSDIARLFDPLGWITPIIFVAKCFIQRLWKLGLEWDEAIPDEMQREWSSFSTQLAVLKQLQIPRRVTTAGTRYNIIGFSDASEKGFAACIYLQCIKGDTLGSLILLSAKSKVAPLKPLTIPKLELQGAVLLIRLLKHHISVLQSHIQIIGVRAFTDSMIVLSWLRTPPYKLKTYVANRVIQIVDEFPTSIWNYIPSLDNPADIASRGALPADLIHSPLWWSGPTQIALSECSDVNNAPEPGPDVPELKPDTAVLLSTSSSDLEPDILTRFSSFTKLQRVVAWSNRFISKLKRHPTPSGPLTVDELNKSVHLIVKLAQRHHFYEEISRLQQGQGITSSLKLLAPVLDQQGLLRVGGRLQNTHLRYPQRHPLILPKRSNLTRLLINHTHITYLHAGPRLVQSILSRRFWIVAGRGVIRQLLGKCVTCFRSRPTLCQPVMGQLPMSRVQPARPFLTVGVDFAGPYDLKTSSRRNAALTKAYICIFVCFVTKAIHIELVTSLSTQAFIASLNRFVSRRGLCTDIYSDCGRNFVGAARYLTDMHALLQKDLAKDQIISFATAQSIKWHFNPPAAPNFGGLWEAGVKSIKFHLKRTFGVHKFTYEEFVTVLHKIEAVLNSRPLAPLSSDIDCLEPLTPGHFLIGGPLIAVPEGPPDSPHANMAARWHHLQKFSQLFWKWWRNDYLVTLTQRAKWHKRSPNVATGALVLIHTPNAPPQQWCLGRILETHPGKDGIVRVVTLRVKGGEVQRPVSKLAPLPVL